MHWLEEEEEEAERVRTRAPGWVVTFADLMSLLMCFFVLLLSYSEMDSDKFKQMAASMQLSLGPAPPLALPNTGLNPGFMPLESPDDPVESQKDQREAQAIRQKLSALIKETQDDARQLTQTLSTQIRNGEVEIETSGRDIIVRLREKGSFDSGSAELNPRSRSVLVAVREMLVHKPGDILVQGHTDDLPIKTARFRSNWELSSVRAVAVAEELMPTGQVAQNRFEVTGLADTRPLVDSSSTDNRARNRRVEIVISQDIAAALTDSDKLLLQKQDAGTLMRALKIQPSRKKTTLPDNIF